MYRYFWKAVFSPSCWGQNYVFSEGVDKIINRLVDTEATIKNPLDKHEISWGGFPVWVANHPYSSFTIHNIRPRRRTIFRARAYLDSVLLQKFEQEFESIDD